MSRQFRVYLLPSDAESLVQELSRFTELKVFQDSSPSYEPLQLSSPVRNSSARLRHDGAKSIRCYLTQSQGAQLKLKYYEKLDRWLIDSASEAVEFSGCDFADSILLQGRLYFQTDLLVGAEIRKQRQQFLAWADALFRRSKKLLHYNPDLQAYVGSGARSFRKEGVGSQLSSRQMASQSMSPS